MLVASIDIEASKAFGKIELLSAIIRIETDDMANFKFGQRKMKLFGVGKAFSCSGLPLCRNI